jgi:hypothetical protein
MEEGRALQVIRIKLLPGAVNLYNFAAKTKWNVPQITLDEAKKKLEKIGKEQYSNGETIEYCIRLPGTIISFSIRRLLVKDTEGDEVGDADRNTFEVGFYDFSRNEWGDLGWNIYDVKGLSSGKYDTNGSYVDPTEPTDYSYLDPKEN